jgi:ABC-type uncharacterized transport system fused permease/ATPase subunit
MSGTTTTERRADHGVLLARLEQMQGDLVDMKAALRELTAAVGRLAVIEEKQSNTAATLERAFTALQKVEDRNEKMELRVKDLELAMPGLKELRGWVIGGICSGVGMIGFAVFKLVLVPGAV